MNDHIEPQKPLEFAIRLAIIGFALRAMNRNRNKQRNEPGDKSVNFEHLPVGCF